MSCRRFLFPHFSPHTHRHTLRRLSLSLAMWRGGGGGPMMLVEKRRYKSDPLRFIPSKSFLTTTSNSPTSFLSHFPSRLPSFYLSTAYFLSSTLPLIISYGFPTFSPSSDAVHFHHQRPSSQFHLQLTTKTKGCHNRERERRKSI